MESQDLELGDAHEIQKTSRSLLYELRLSHHTHQSSPLICNAPDALRILSPDSFRPRAVSIGPVHDPYFDFEDQKISYLINLMNRFPSHEEETLKSCVQKVYTSLKRIKACYDPEIIGNYDNASIVKMMVKDACFILEFINKISVYDKSCRGNMLQEQTIIYDLVLLENQIPFFILNQIFHCTILKYKPNISLIEFIRPLLNLLNIFKADVNTNNISITSTDHILSILHQCYKPQDPITSTIVTSTIQSAVDLDMTGVHFKPNRNPKWAMEMDVKLNKFPCFSWCWGKSTLRMPALYVHDFTELVLRNLIAYEEHSRQTHKYITSYAYTMDMLVNTQEDISKLVDSKVLVNFMGSNEKAANMINNICKEIAREHFFYGEAWGKLNTYCNSYWPKNIAWLNKTYFNSPWNIIALIAGIILFVLTVVQTIFTIKSA